MFSLITLYRYLVAYSRHVFFPLSAPVCLRMIGLPSDLAIEITLPATLTEIGVEEQCTSMVRCMSAFLPGGVLDGPAVPGTFMSLTMCSVPREEYTLRPWMPEE